MDFEGFNLQDRKFKQHEGANHIDPMKKCDTTAWNKARQEWIFNVTETTPVDVHEAAN